MDNKVTEEILPEKKKIYFERSSIILLLIGFFLFKVTPLFWNNVEIYILQEFCFSLIISHYAILLGMMTSFLTWHIMYFDSAIPGEDPPSPLSPTRKQAHANLHLNYIFALCTGPLVTLLLCTEII